MKTTTKVAFSAALILGALTSCDKENGFFGRIGSSTIGISSVKAEAPATKAVTEETSQVTLEDGSVFTIHKTIEPYTTEPQTKAVIKKAEDINSFTLYGYLDAAELAKAEGADPNDRNNPNFIAGASVKKDGSVWHIDGDNYWRNGITHYFWAQSGAAGMTTTANSASFTKAANSDEDILVAYASKKWYEHSGSDHSSDNLDINFKHALSAAKFERGTINYIQRETTAPVQEGRIVLEKINLLRMTGGKCSVTSDMDFKWEDIAKIGAEEIGIDETILSIPQETAALELYYKDTYRTTNKPAIISLNDHWKAGNMYTYTINGTVSVPKLNEEAKEGEGIKLHFEKNERRGVAVDSLLNVSHYKTIKISWEGLPNTQGNGTFSIVSTRRFTESELKDLGTSVKEDAWAEKYKNDLIFMEDAKNKKVLVGKITNNACSGTISIPDNTDTINIYFEYRGGDGTAKTEWTIKNYTIEVLEYK